MLPEKPYALSCDRNSEPILEVFKERLLGRKGLLEIAAGTGQHAIFMAPHFLEMNWTLADQAEKHEGINMWLKDFPRANVKGPVEYSVGKSPAPVGDFDTVFTANFLHIISWDLCLKFFDDLKKILKPGGQYYVYGAFNYDGKFSSESNERFEEWLKENFPGGGIRDFEKVRDELGARGLHLKEDIEMPANNRMLVFEVTSS